MKLNGASKAAASVVGFLALLLSIGGSYLATRERLTSLEATAKVELRAVNEKVDSLKTDVLRRIERADDKLDAHIRGGGK